jgi:hypothetical protein
MMHGPINIRCVRSVSFVDLKSLPPGMFIVTVKSLTKGRQLKQTRIYVPQIFFKPC